VTTIDICVFDGLDELDVVGPLEVLRATAMGAEDLVVRLAGRGSLQPVAGTFGLSFTPDVVFTPGEAEVVLVPGGGWAARAERSVWGEVQRGDWLPLLADAAERAELVASVCTGAMLLAHAGVIGSRPATTHHVAMADLAATGADVIEARVVDDGSLVTGGGVTSGIDVGLHLVRRLVGDDVAEEAARRIEYDPAPVHATAQGS